MPHHAGFFGIPLPALDHVQAVVVKGRPGQFSEGFDLDILTVGGKRRDHLVRETWELFGRLFAPRAEPPG